MKKKSIGLNVVLNVIKQCCAILFPIITFPYVSRVLSTENYGKYNFGNSIIVYVTLFATLGITNYAIREGARIRKDKQAFQKLAEQIFTINCLTTIVSYVIFIVLLIFVPKLHAYWLLLSIQSITVLLTTIGADWVNSIYEDFFYITIRYLIVQIVSIILMFILVKKPEDYIIYAGIHVFANVGANVANFIHIRRYTHLRLTRHMNIKQHIKPMLMLFCNSLSVQLYINSDVTLLGIMQNDVAVGIYSAAVKIYNIVKQLLNAVIVVIIPRISALLGENKIKEYNKLLGTVFHGILSVIMPLITGIFMLSYEIIALIGGEEYAVGYWSLRVLSLALCGAVFANFFTNAILVPNKKEKNFMIATLIAASVNIGLNFIFIPLFSYVGAAITTVIAEFIVLGFGHHYAKGFYNFKFSVRDILSCIIGCIGIVIVCAVAKLLFSNSFIILCVSALISVVVYGMILIVMKNSLTNIIIQVLKKKLKKS